MFVIFYLGAIMLLVGIILLFAGDKPTKAIDKKEKNEQQNDFLTRGVVSICFFFTARVIFFFAAFLFKNVPLFAAFFYFLWKIAASPPAMSFSLDDYVGQPVFILADIIWWFILGNIIMYFMDALKKQ